MADDWTPAMLANALTAIEVIRRVGATDERQKNGAKALFEVLNLLPGDLTGERFAELGPDLISGLINVAVAITEDYSDHAKVPVDELLDNLTNWYREHPFTTH